MPKYDDLNFLRNEFQKLGNEIEIRKEKNEKMNTPEIPEFNEESTPEEVHDELLDDDLLNDIQSDFAEGLTFDENEEDEEDNFENEDNSSIDNDIYNQDENPENDWDSLKDDSFNDLDDLNLNDDNVNDDNDTENMDDFFDTAKDDFPNFPTEDATSDFDDVKNDDDLDDLAGESTDDDSLDGFDGLDDLTGDTTGSDNAELNDFEDLEGDTEDDDPLGDLNDLGDLTGNTSGSDDSLDDLTGNTASDDQLDAFDGLGDLEEDTTDGDQLDGLDDLTGDTIGGDNAELDDFEDLEGDTASNDPLGELGDLGDLAGDSTDDELDGFDGLNDLTGDTADSDDPELDDFEDLAGDTESNDPLGELGDLDDLVGDSTGDDELDGFDGLEGLNDDRDNTGLDDLDDIGDISGKNTDDDPLNGFDGLEGLDELNEDTESNDEIDDLNDSDTNKSNGLSDDIEDFSLENIDAINNDDTEANFDIDDLENIDEIDEADANDIEDNISIESKNEKNIPASEESGAIELTTKQRKNIILTLTSLPKEAEIKIAEAIVNEKYSDQQLQPLIKALIQNEKPATIYKFYEAITDDRSLAHISSEKYTGQYFEDKQKSFLYNFEKNIFPILTKIAAATFITFLMVLFFFGLVKPWFQANHYYKMGREYIAEEEFDKVEPVFEKAYDIWPKRSELIRYARAYRDKKRYLNAEIKYEKASNLKFDEPLKLEFADFYREFKKYEKAINILNPLIQSNDKNINAHLGLAKTYLDWSKTVESKRENAKEHYQSVINYKIDNEEAIYGLLNIHITEKNDKKIETFYNFIENNFKTVDVPSYSRLAEYHLDNKDFTNIKTILTRARSSLKKSDNYPELDYQESRYLKMLNFSEESGQHLRNANSRLEFLLNNKDGQRQYTERNYRNLHAKVYNDLGEIYYNNDKMSLEAYEFFMKARSKNPNYPKPYHNLGNFHFFKGDYKEALDYYEQSEDRDFTNDIQDYRMGWLYHKDKKFYNSFQKINKLLLKDQDNNQLKFFLGTIHYRLDNYDIAESMLIETFRNYETRKESISGFDINNDKHRFIIDMLYKTSNNLGASYYSKFIKTRISRYYTLANEYFTNAIEYKDIHGEYPYTPAYLRDENETNNTEIMRKVQRSKPELNLRMSLYPEAEGRTEPLLFEDFNKYAYE